MGLPPPILTIMQSYLLYGQVFKVEGYDFWISVMGIIYVLVSFCRSPYSTSSLSLYSCEFDTSFPVLIRVGHNLGRAGLWRWECAPLELIWPQTPVAANTVLYTSHHKPSGFCWLWTEVFFIKLTTDFPEAIFYLMSLSPPIRRLSAASTSSKREEDLINAYEAEEERIINVLSRKLEKVSGCCSWGSISRQLSVYWY